MIRIGLAGLGAAGRAFLPAVSAHPGFDLAAVCDVSPKALESFAALNIPTHSDLQQMLANASLDAVYVGTPTDLHHDHVLASLAAGKHVLVEKPIAITVAHALEMARAADAAGLSLIVGHSHSHDLPIRSMREIITSGRLGELRMIHNWCYTDWVYRPRRAAELRPELGGSVTFRQGSHQFDIMRYLVGAPVEAVSATTFDWDPARPTIGAQTVTLKFSGGAVGTAIYNGYGRFLSTELTGGVGEWGAMETQASPHRKAANLEDEEAELLRKQERAASAIPAGAPHQPHFGLTIASGTLGEMRQSPGGLLIYSDKGREEITLAADVSPRQLVLDEFANAIAGEGGVVHTGHWGAAILEICAAVLESAQLGQEIRLSHQI